MLVYSLGPSEPQIAAQLAGLFPALPENIAQALVTGQLVPPTSFLHLCTAVHTSCGATLPNAEAVAHSHMVRRRDPTKVSEAWAAAELRQGAGAATLWADEGLHLTRAGR